MTDTRQQIAKGDLRTLLIGGIAATVLLLGALCGLYFHIDNQTRELRAGQHALATNLAILVDRDARQNSLPIIPHMIAASLEKGHD